MADRKKNSFHYVGARSMRAAFAGKACVLMHYSYHLCVRIRKLYAWPVRVLRMREKNYERT